MNLRAHAQGLPLVQPMYYRHGGTQEAYQVPNQYCFSSELMVCPITKPMHPELLGGSFDAWPPRNLLRPVQWQEIPGRPQAAAAPEPGYHAGAGPGGRHCAFGGLGNPWQWGGPAGRPEYFALCRSGGLLYPV